MKIGSYSNFIDKLKTFQKITLSKKTKPYVKFDKMKYEYSQVGF